ncbi:uncharacterized protein [Euphorbia lathyris]|uniref:uncharacterized protein isoform X2 n=1 Tax=Euphorbia lathyris TaxID=212925 RepID=UPI003313B0B7
MAEAEEDSQVNSPLPPPFLEVSCKSLGKTCRFASGTKAGFAVSLLNRKLEIGSSGISYIEAIKEGEEPISFGPDALLLDYGDGWKLQTVTDLDFGARKADRIRLIPGQDPNVRSTGSSRHANTVPESGINFLYVTKILFALISLFVLGAVFTLALENLPRVILFINSFV